MNKKISVIMSVYNAQDYLKIAINSIINQTYQNWEFIICDDASTDNSWEILKDFKAKYYDEFIIFKNPKNMRLAYSLNECIKRSTGELIARMDADDISHPMRFQKQVSFLNNNKNVNLVGTELIQFSDTNSKHIKADPKPNPKILLKKVAFFHATIMTYKYVYTQLNSYTVRRRTYIGQDYDLWFKFFHNGFYGENILEPLYFQRIGYQENRSDFRFLINYKFNMFKTQILGFYKLRFPFYYYFLALIINIYTLIKSLIFRSQNR